VRDFYSDRPDGIQGNDDCGQMSAWYVLATLGLYPVVPAGGDWVIAAPQVRAATVQLAGGRRLQLRADGWRDGATWADGARLNGRPVAPTALRHADLVAGGELRFRMRRPPS
jgi:putative alpha-1,2-mannosidase